MQRNTQELLIINELERRFRLVGANGQKHNKHDLYSRLILLRCNEIALGALSAGLVSIDDLLCVADANILEKLFSDKKYLLMLSNPAILQKIQNQTFKTRAESIMNAGYFLEILFKNSQSTVLNNRDDIELASVLGNMQLIEAEFSEMDPSSLEKIYQKSIQCGDEFVNKISEMIDKQRLNEEILARTLDKLEHWVSDNYFIREQELQQKVSRGEITPEIACTRLAEFEYHLRAHYSQRLEAIQSKYDKSQRSLETVKNLYRERLMTVHTMQEQTSQRLQFFANTGQSAAQLPGQGFFATQAEPMELDKPMVAPMDFDQPIATPSLSRPWR